MHRYHSWSLKQYERIVRVLSALARFQCCVVFVTDGSVRAETRSAMSSAGKGSRRDYDVHASPHVTCRPHAQSDVNDRCNHRPDQRWRKQFNSYKNLQRFAFLCFNRVTHYINISRRDYSGRGSSLQGRGRPSTLSVKGLIYTPVESFAN